MPVGAGYAAGAAGPAMRVFAEGPLLQLDQFLFNGGARQELIGERRCSFRIPAV